MSASREYINESKEEEEMERRGGGRGLVQVFLKLRREREQGGPLKI